MRRARELYEHVRLEHLPAQARFNAVAATFEMHDGDPALAASRTRHGTPARRSHGDIALWVMVETRLLLGQVELRLGHTAAAARLANEARFVLAQVPDAASLPRDPET